MISPDGAGALPRQVNDNIVQTLAMLKTSTGLDLEALVQKAVGASSSASGSSAAVSSSTEGADSTDGNS